MKPTWKTACFISSYIYFGQDCTRFVSHQLGTLFFFTANLLHLCPNPQLCVPTYFLFDGDTNLSGILYLTLQYNASLLDSFFALV